MSLYQMILQRNNILKSFEYMIIQFLILDRYIQNILTYHIDVAGHNQTKVCNKEEFKGKHFIVIHIWRPPWLMESFELNLLVYYDFF